MAGSAEMHSLRPSIEVFAAEAGEIYLIEPGPDPDLIVEDPEAADHLLLAELARGPIAIAGLIAALDRGGVAISEEALSVKLANLAAAGVLVTGPPERDTLAAEDAARFDRQLPYFAETGSPAAAQRRLFDAKVVILGCGGLGTWALGALAGAGIRHFVLVDDDTVELSNLNRQILYALADVGRPKVECAAAWLRRFEPRAEPEPVRRRIAGAADLRPLLTGADVLIHAADSPPYEIVRWADEACRAAGVPYVTAAQLPPVLKLGPTYVPGRSACFACQELAARSEFALYDELTRFRRDHAVAATTLGPASGVVGTLLAMEVMHLLLGDAAVTTEARALLLDMKTLETRWESIDRRPDCPACGGMTPSAPDGGRVAR